MLTYEAAIEGLGIAMRQMFLRKDDIAAGTLVPLFDRPLTRQSRILPGGGGAPCKIAKPRVFCGG
jgi:hypothetical protein